MEIKFIIRTSQGYYQGNGFTKLPLEAMRFDTRNEAAKRCKLRSDWSVEDIQVPSVPSAYQYEQIKVERGTMRNFVAVLILILTLQGCSMGGGSKTPPPPPPAQPTITSVAIAPQNPTMNTGATLQFSATVLGTGNFSTAVTWSVTGLGSISQSGLYTADANTPGTPFVTATSVEDPTKSGTANLTVTASTVLLAGWHGVLTPSDCLTHPIDPCTTALPMDFDLKQTGTSLQSGPVLIVAENNQQISACTNIDIQTAESSTAFLKPQPNNPFPQMTGSISGQNVTLSYAPYAGGNRPPINFTGTMSTNSLGFGTISGTYTTSATPCFPSGSTSGTFSFTQYDVFDGGTWSGTFNESAQTTVAITMNNSTINTAADSFGICAAGSVDMNSIETAGRYFHIWSINGGASSTNLTAWGLSTTHSSTTHQVNAFVVGASIGTRRCFDPLTPLNATMTRQ